jgi:hypothetical protein
LFAKLIFNTPWYYFLLCLVAALLLATLLYFRNKKNSDIPQWAVKLMFALRFLSLSLIFLFLLNLLLRHVKNETQNPLIILAVDNSRSMLANADSASVKQEFVGKLRQLKEQLGNKFEVKTLLFGGNTEATDKSPDFSAKETDLSNLLSEVENNYSNRNVGAMVVVSDGIYNKGANPVFLAEKLGYPIYTVAMGDTSEIHDVSVQKINHNQFAYLGNIFPVEAVIQAKKFAGKEILVSLFHDGVKKAEQKLTISSDHYLTTCSFTAAAETGGVQKYSVKVNVLDGEKNISNNAQSFLIEVIDNRYKVLLLTNFPHPDIAAIHDVITNNSAYELNTVPASEFHDPLKPYSLVIIHGFSAQQQQLVNECKNLNIPYWIINPTIVDYLNGIRITGAIGKTNDAEPWLNNSFGLFTLSDELKKFVKDLPAIKVFFGNYSVSNGMNVLLQQKIGMVETDHPILSFTENGGVKNGLFIGDGLWKWKLRDYEEHNNNNLFNELVSKCIQYLSVKADKSYFRISAPKIINENEKAEISAEVYNKSYELITDPDVSLVLTNPDKKQFNYTFSKTGKQYYLNLGYLPAGEYRYEAKVKSGGELFVKQGLIVVKEIVAEKINTVANHQLLYQMSSRSGGKMLYPAQMQQLNDAITKNQLIKPITFSSNETSPLIDLKWLFYLLIFFLAAEWYFRKRYTTI